MLSNAYFLAKFRFDTAENEPAKNLQNFANFADSNSVTAREKSRSVQPIGSPAARIRARPGRAGAPSPPDPAQRSVTGCGKLHRARSRLYRNEILQVDMRLKALAEIYTMHSFAQLYNLKNLTKFVKIR